MLRGGRSSRVKKNKQTKHGEDPSQSDHKNTTNKHPTTAAAESGKAEQDAARSQKDTNNADKAPKPTGEGMHSIWQFIIEPKHSNALIAIFTVLICVTGIWYTIFAALQWGAMKDSNQISRASLESVQRAFVSLQTLRVDRFNQVNNVKSWQISPTWENTGATPAVDIAQYFNAETRKSAPDGKDFIGRISDAYEPTYLGPRSARDIGILVKEDAFIPTVKQLGEVSTFTDSPYLWGWLCYRDTFTGTDAHVSEFCFQVVRVVPSPASEGAQRVTLLSCDLHNCVDGSCPDASKIIELAEGSLKKGKLREHP